MTEELCKVLSVNRFDCVDKNACKKKDEENVNTSINNKKSYVKVIT